MPAPLPIDWDYVKLLRSQGLQYKDIAKKIKCNVGTLTNRASRENWAEQITKARSDASAFKEDSSASEAQSKSAAWQARMWEAIERQSRAISALVAPISTKELYEHEKLLQIHIENGRKMFELDKKDSDGGTVKVLVLNGLNRSPDTESPTNTPQAIDVQAVTDSKDSQSPPGVQPA